MSASKRYTPPATLPQDAADGLTTERLILRRYTMADLPEMTAMHADPDMTRYLGGVMTRQQSSDFLEYRILRYYDEHPGFGIWASCLRSTGECIGMHALNHIHGEALIQVGYRIAKAHWGQGYATEMSLALIHYGFVQKCLPVVTAITDLGHVVSQQVLLNVGLIRQPDRSFAHPKLAPTNPYAYFEARPEAWLAAFVSGDHGTQAQ